MNGRSVPPQDLDAERSLLSACMWGAQAVEVARFMVLPEAFYSRGHQMIFQAICNLSDNGERVDSMTVVGELRRMGKLTDVGGMFDVAELSGAYIVPEGADYMARKVMDAHIRRQLLIHHQAQASRQWDMAVPVEDLIRDSACNLGTEKVGDDVWEFAGDVVDRSFSGFQRAIDFQGQISGLPTGILPLDDLLDGLQPSDSIIIAARPSMGKTALALSISWEVARTAPVGFVSIEMANKGLVDRLACLVAGVDSQDFRRGRLGEQQVADTRQAFKDVSRSKLILSDRLRDVGRIEIEARRLKREHGIGLLVVDYLQLCDAPKSGNRDRNREQAVSEVSRGVKAIAKSLNIPVVTLAQLNRESEKRKDKRPTLADLRESGSIEQDADVVLLLHRPEKSGPPIQAGESVLGLMEINVAKQRQGPVGVIRAHFSDRSGRFSNWTY